MLQMMLLHPSLATNARVVFKTCLIVNYQTNFIIHQNVDTYVNSLTIYSH